MRYVEESMKGKESDAIIPWEGSGRRREVAICEHFEGESEKKRELQAQEEHQYEVESEEAKKKKIVGRLYRRTRKHTTTR